MNEEVGEIFHQETKYCYEKLPSGGLDISSIPETYKNYPNAKKIELPSFESIKTLPIDEILKRRKSVRHFNEKPVKLNQLSFLIWASTGIQRVERGREFRTAPSAGALYPIETYLVVNNVEGLSEGLYHYSIKEHLLEELDIGDLGGALAEAALGQKMCAAAPVVFIWTAIFQRAKWKYQQRAYRYVYLDAGHIAANLALAAVGIEMGTCQVGALFDDEINNIIGVDGVEESVLYMSVLGYPQ